MPETPIDKLIRVTASEDTRAQALTREWNLQSQRVDALLAEIRLQQAVVETLEARMLMLYDTLWPEPQSANNVS